MNSNTNKTLHEMLNDRGYTGIMHNTSEFIIATDDCENKIIIFFILDMKVSVKRVKSIKEIITASENVYTCLIIIYKHVITSFAKQFILTDMDMTVQTFSENEMSFNITKHMLVPKHELLCDEEKRMVLSQYKTKLKHFPILPMYDPVSRYYGYLPGNIVKITRPSINTGYDILYRVVM
jgi:DNA-directed RNA polymerase I, II, and III subunit RPABC1